MIGALQRNKAKLAVSLFDVIQTLDRASLASEIDKRARAIDKCIDAYIQVNLSEEPQKAGVLEQALPELLALCAPLANLRIVGLMTIPAPVPNPADNRPVFARLRSLRDMLRTQPGGEALRELSMGMSRDFEIAIEEGATVVRVGSDLFGPRPAKP
jgi:pyridoxal phosphate enzyme (YggS family)